MDDEQGMSEFELVKKISDILSHPDGFGRPVQVLSHFMEGNTLSGTFRDYFSNRVYSFEITKNGIGYNPAMNTDSYPVEVLDSAFDAFSQGYFQTLNYYGAIADPRYDAPVKKATTGKQRTKVPTCKKNTYACGKTCIPTSQKCRRGLLGSVAVNAGLLLVGAAALHEGQQYAKTARGKGLIAGAKAGLASAKAGAEGISDMAKYTAKAQGHGLQHAVGQLKSAVGNYAKETAGAIKSNIGSSINEAASNIKSSAKEAYEAPIKAQQIRDRS